MTTEAGRVDTLSETPDVIHNVLEVTNAWNGRDGLFMASSRSSSSVGKLLVAATLVSVIADSPQKGQVRVRPAMSAVRAVADPGVPDETQEKFLKQNCRFGKPAKQDHVTALLGPTMVIVRETYVLEHSATSKTPYWVSELLTAELLQGDSGRLKPEPFRPEPLVPSGSRAELKDYRHSGYARGHMMPDADRASNDLKRETYVLSNMVPQFGPFNSGVWLKLEKAVRAWAVARKEIHVITGPLWFDPDEADPTKADGQIEYSVIGPNQVAVPTHLYKIVLSQNPSTKKWEALAFLFPNIPKYPSSPPLEKFLTTIDFLEEHTGYDFFPEFHEDDQKKLESTLPTVVWDK